MPAHLLPILAIGLLLIAAPFVFSAEASDPKLNLARVKWAIEKVENWDGRSVGASGELGRFQIQPAVWCQFSEKPLTWAYGNEPQHMAEQERVAAALVEWIDARLPSLHLPRTSRSIGLVWTVGYGNMRAGKYGRSKRQYADRVSNTYHDWTQNHSP